MEYRVCKGSIPVDIENEEYISIERDTPVKMYGIGFQAAKCIPEIPEWFCRKYLPHDWECKILEPFSGSGTTILEGIKNKNTVYWIDNNPLSRLISECKSVPINLEILENEKNRIISAVKKTTDVKITIQFANIDLWFQKSVQEALTILKNEIALVEDENVKNAINVALSITVRKMSEMEDSMILAARRSNNREMPEYSREDVYDNFESNIQKISDAYKEWNEYLGNERRAFPIETNDARHINRENYFDAIVTSPPYINAMDYIWATKFELHWLELVANDRERLEVSNTEIGTERIPAKEYKELAVTQNEKLNQVLKDIYEGTVYKATKGQNELRSRVAYKYFNDMRAHFKEAYKALKNGGKYCFIIGDTSKICGVEIPVADMLRDIAVEEGFEETFRFNLLLKNRRLNIPRASFAGTIKHDTVIVLEKRGM